MAQITGRCVLSVNGAMLRSKTGANLSGVGGVQRKAVMGHQVWGYAEETTAPKIEATLAHTADLSLVALSQVVDATVTFEADTGATWILRHAWCETAPGVSDGEGDVKVTFTGLTCEEMA
jgi:hypothetical protein